MNSIPSLYCSQAALLSMYLCLITLSSLLLVVCLTCNHTRNKSEHPTTVLTEGCDSFLKICGRHLVPPVQSAVVS